MHPRPVYQSIQLSIHLYSSAASSCITACNSQIILPPSCHFLFFFNISNPILWFATTHSLILSVLASSECYSTARSASHFHCGLSRMDEEGCISYLRSMTSWKCDITAKPLCIFNTRKAWLALDISVERKTNVTLMPVLEQPNSEELTNHMTWGTSINTLCTVYIISIAVRGPCDDRGWAIFQAQTGR